MIDADSNRHKASNQFVLIDTGGRGFYSRITDLATGVSRLRVREFGTVYLPYCGSPALNLDTLSDF